ncbi:hypothetical protein NQ318_011333 [Aromia moschata]|uniref:FAD dependent oxidoreductase domain-containing protein n=1 Tax=Aromia moschata TaxID=1265417 RepID=A0AAV8XLV0_9CUCU|nr:hypothetical protein NQ318_011333 [Aromia moschata]
MSQVAVIGCGVIGLTSALAIQRSIRNTKVTIFTKDITPNTTGDVAAGLWEPYLVDDTEEKSFGGKAKEAGISLQPIINLSDKRDHKIPDWVNVTLGHSELSRDHLVNLSRRYNKNFTAGYLFVSFTWEASYFLPFLQREFEKNGGRVVMKEIKDFNELAHYDVIVNCTGLESRNLTGDKKVSPIRGQIARVRGPWQFHTYIVDSEKSCYIIPNINCVILGGTKQSSYNIEVDEVDKQEILSKCSDLLPAIKAAEVIKHQVGLRPGRDKVRLEIEIKERDKDTIKIVHNYGHGGSGITLSVGCAVEAAELVEKVLNQRNKSKL